MFYREARTLAAHGYEVVFIAQHTKEEIIDGVRIIPLPVPVNRFDRMTRVLLCLFWQALRQRAWLYHLHSPELLPIGIVLKILGGRLIYDVHEAFGEKILCKNWIKAEVRPLVRALFLRLEAWLTKYVDHVIAADRFVAAQFTAPRSVTVLANYPVLSLMEPSIAVSPDSRVDKGKTIVMYVGDLSRERCLFEMLDAICLLRHTNIELHLIGRCEFKQYERVLSRAEGVRYYGLLPFKHALSHLRSASIGLVLFQPVPAYLYAGENTNKLFEYMAYGLPIIGSNFPTLKEFIEGNGCGICVDPTSPKQIASAIGMLASNESLRAEMGRNGRQAIADKYCWENEGRKLIKIYERLGGISSLIRQKEKHDWT
jgi:glycosyltransferase involved in cell wall biosynthesis